MERHIGYGHCRPVTEDVDALVRRGDGGSAMSPHRCCPGGEGLFDELLEHGLLTLTLGLALLGDIVQVLGIRATVNYGYNPI